MDKKDMTAGERLVGAFLASFFALCLADETVAKVERKMGVKEKTLDEVEQRSTLAA